MAAVENAGADTYVDLETIDLSDMPQSTTYVKRQAVAGIVGELILIRPTDTGCIKTKFDDDGNCSDYVDADVWFVTEDGDADPLPEPVRLWGQVLVEKLGERKGRTLAVRIIRPKRAYLFDKLSESEVALAKDARRSL